MSHEPTLLGAASAAGLAGARFCQSQPGHRRGASSTTVHAARDVKMIAWAAGAARGAVMPGGSETTARTLWPRVEATISQEVNVALVISETAGGRTTATDAAVATAVMMVMRAMAVTDGGAALAAAVRGAGAATGGRTGGTTGALADRLVDGAIEKHGARGLVAGATVDRKAKGATNGEDGANGAIRMTGATDQATGLREETIDEVTP